MKKAITGVLITSAAVVSAVYLLGYDYIFKALGKNLQKGPMTPSTDDAEKFPSRIISNAQPKPLQKHSQYNEKPLSETLLNELKKTRTSSLLVIKDKEIVAEHYWKNHSQTSLMNSFSMTKGFLSILTGFAIDDGFLESEEQLVSSVFPEYQNRKFGKYLKIKHLMTMQAGFDWEEEYRHPFAENSKQYFIDDLQKQVLETEIKEMPGKKYEYQSIAPQLLGMILTKTTGQTLSSYMSEKLWKPLGMEYSGKWSTDEIGMEKAFCCLHATPRDLAKIGLLVMQDGMWNGKQLLSRDYCTRMLQPTIENDAFCYTIWAGDDFSSNCRFFYGFLGQFIILIPEKNMVIVKTGFYNRLEVDKKKRPLQVKILVDELISL